MEPTRTKPKLQRQNATVTAEVVDLELVRDVVEQAKQRTYPRITDKPSNWDDIYPPTPGWNFEEWKRRKIEQGTWVPDILKK